MSSDSKWNKMNLKRAQPYTFREDLSEFKIADYDVIGFDLDNTLAKYRITNVIDLEYDAVANFLVAHRGYSGRHLLKPFKQGLDFIIKGLFLDLQKGNIIKLSATGEISACYHGSHVLDRKQIVKAYGEDMHWELTDKYIQDPLQLWNGPEMNKIRALLDNFDVSLSLIFARLIDTIDEDAEDDLSEDRKYNVWPDISDAMNDMFRPEHFAIQKGNFFQQVQNNPEEFYYKCIPRVINWLRELRARNKLVILITGSDYDFANHTATYTLGADWRSLFDIVVCFAKKPGFFSAWRPFMGRTDSDDQDLLDEYPLRASDLRRGGIYRNGNWVDLHEFCQRESGKHDLNCVYIGDNMMQDVFTPNAMRAIDVVAVIEELEAESAHAKTTAHPHRAYLTSALWGSYFRCDNGDPVVPAQDTLWADWIHKHARLVVSSVDQLAACPLEHSFM